MDFRSLNSQRRNEETIAIVNTHFTAYRENWRYRLSQAEDISKAIQSIETDTVILLGDLNGDIHYSGDTFTADDGEEVHGWLVNARSTPMISAFADLQDWSPLDSGKTSSQNLLLSAHIESRSEM